MGQKENMAEFNYSFIQNRVFAKIAYFDLADRYEYYTSFGTDKVTLGNLLNSEEKEQLAELKISEEEFSQWKLIAVHDTNDDNGFYACVIDTGNGNAAVAFRGSENLLSTKQSRQDWGQGDFMLMNSTLTTQQAEVRRFMEQNSELLSQYSLTPVGHSLGGNLAEYFTIVSNEFGLNKKIKQCVSLDGPGHSKEFIAEHEKQIAEMADRMVHYRWSFVGELLNDLPIESDKYIDIEVKGGNFATKHYLENIADKGKNGFEPAKKSSIWTWENTLKALTLTFDDDPVWFTTPVVVILTEILYSGMALKELFDGTLINELRGDIAISSANPDFYIDTDEFERLGGECESVTNELGNIAKQLRILRARPQISGPKLWEHTIVSIMKLIYKVYEAIDDAVNAASFSAKMAEECIPTIDAIRSYFWTTASEFRNLENAITADMEVWEPIQEGKNE